MKKFLEKKTRGDDTWKINEKMILMGQGFLIFVKKKKKRSYLQVFSFIIKRIVFIFLRVHPGIILRNISYHIRLFGKQ